MGSEDQTPTASLRDFCEALSIMTDMIVPNRARVLLPAQLTREVANPRELIESKVAGAVVMLEGRITSAVSAINNLRLATDRHTDVSIKEIIETRLLGMDKAISLLQEIQNRVPTLMDETKPHVARYAMEMAHGRRC
jgi:hypothetical protein